MILITYYCNLLLIAIAVFRSCAAKSPNILFILTDDQDLLLKSLEYLPKIDELLIKQGAIFSNAVSFSRNCMNINF